MEKPKDVAFVVPANSAIGIVDLASYQPYLHPLADAGEMSSHFLDAMCAKSLLVWGTGASANWRILIQPEPSTTVGFQTFEGLIRVTTDRLYFTSYEELSFAAHSRRAQLPRTGGEDWWYPLAQGVYLCRVVQLYDPELADSSQVFRQESPHFLVHFSPASDTDQTLNHIPWFPAYC